MVIALSLPLRFLWDKLHGAVLRLRLTVGKLKLKHEDRGRSVRCMRVTVNGGVGRIYTYVTARRSAEGGANSQHETCTAGTDYEVRT